MTIQAVVDHPWLTSNGELPLILFSEPLSPYLKSSGDIIKRNSTRLTLKNCHVTDGALQDISDILECSSVESESQASVL